MTDPLQNAYAVHLKEIQCVALFDIDNHSYRYSLSQLCLYTKYNLTLRSPKFNYTRTPTPGGYDKFITLWNRDYACPWKFAYLDDGQVVVPGDPITIHVLAPPTSSDPEKAAELEDDLREMSRFIAKCAIVNDKAGERKKKICLEAKQFPSASSCTIQQFKRGLRSGRQSRAVTPRTETESLRGSVPPESIRRSIPPLNPINDPTLALLDDNTHLEGASTDHAGGEGSKDKGGERAADGEDSSPLPAVPLGHAPSSLAQNQCFSPYAQGHPSSPGTSSDVPLSPFASFSSEHNSVCKDRSDLSQAQVAQVMLLCSPTTPVMMAAMSNSPSTLLLNMPTSQPAPQLLSLTPKPVALTTMDRVTANGAGDGMDASRSDDLDGELNMDALGDLDARTTL
ncbi:unnamed protein product [Somion occarium]|uniref:Uncharacterized protein n=1 Tax=Somion occarium TaxID=3059160 RepID=A0ABP1DI85_9APHY